MAGISDLLCESYAHCSSSVVNRSMSKAEAASINNRDILFNPRSLIFDGPSAFIIHSKAFCSNHRPHTCTQPQNCNSDLDLHCPVSGCVDSPCCHAESASSSFTRSSEVAFASRMVEPVLLELLYDLHVSKSDDASHKRLRDR